MAKTVAEIIQESSAKWSEVIGSPITSTLSLPEQAENVIKTDTNDLQRLGQNFLIPEPKDLPVNLNFEFNPFLAEPLLREGSLLIDRCLQERREYQELATKWFEARVQVDELIRLSQITSGEEETYDVAIQIAKAEIKSLEEEKRSADESKSKTDPLMNTWDEETKLLVNNNRWAAAGVEWALRGDKAFFGSPDPPFSMPTPNRVIDLINYSAQYSAALPRKHQKTLLDIQRAEYASKSTMLALKIAQATSSAALKESQAEFQKERNEVARLVALRRSQALTEKDGALNYGEQLKPLSDRFKNDLIAAWLRLSAAAEGFHQLYNYPSSLFPEKAPDGTIDFDDLVTWCQLTNTWLASFLDTQQQVTRSFSLEQLCTEQKLKFEDGLTTGQWRFGLREEHFYKRQMVRMRGLAIQIDSGNIGGSWNVSITPPGKALNDPKNQEHIKTLFLGRVNERTFAVIPEGSAPPKLYNGSPIGEDSSSGEWKIEVFGSSTSGAKVSDIRDIDIHLTVALV